MKNLLALFLLTLQLIFSWGPLAQAQTSIPPKPATSIYVQDYAKVLSSQTKATINAYSSAIADKTTFVTGWWVLAALLVGFFVLEPLGIPISVIAGDSLNCTASIETPTS